MLILSPNLSPSRLENSQLLLRIMRRNPSHSQTLLPMLTLMLRHQLPRTTITTTMTAVTTQVEMEEKAAQVTVARPPPSSESLKRVYSRAVNLFD